MPQDTCHPPAALCPSPVHSCTHQPIQSQHCRVPALAPHQPSPTGTVHPAAPHHHPPLTSHRSWGHHWCHPSPEHPVPPAPHPSGKPRWGTEGAPAPAQPAASTHPHHTSPPWWAATGPWPEHRGDQGPVRGSRWFLLLCSPGHVYLTGLCKTSTSSTRSWVLGHPPHRPAPLHVPGQRWWGQSPRDSPRHSQVGHQPCPRGVTELLVPGNATASRVPQASTAGTRPLPPQRGQSCSRCPVQEARHSARPHRGPCSALAPCGTRTVRKATVHINHILPPACCPPRLAGGSTGLGVMLCSHSALSQRWPGHVPPRGHTAQGPPRPPRTAAAGRPLRQPEPLLHRTLRGSVRLIPVPPTQGHPWVHLPHPTGHPWPNPPRSAPTDPSARGRDSGGEGEPHGAGGQVRVSRQSGAGGSWGYGGSPGEGRRQSKGRGVRPATGHRHCHHPAGTDVPRSSRGAAGSNGGHPALPPARSPRPRRELGGCSGPLPVRQLHLPVPPAAHRDPPRADGARFGHGFPRTGSGMPGIGTGCPAPGCPAQVRDSRRWNAQRRDARHGNARHRFGMPGAGMPRTPAPRCRAPARDADGLGTAQPGLAPGSRGGAGRVRDTDSGRSRERCRVPHTGGRARGGFRAGCRHRAARPSTGSRRVPVPVPGPAGSPAARGRAGGNAPWR